MLGIILLYLIVLIAKRVGHSIVYSVPPNFTKWHSSYLMPCQLIISSMGSLHWVSAGQGPISPFYMTTYQSEWTQVTQRVRI